MKKRIIGIILTVAMVLTLATGTVSASVDGITKDNYKTTKTKAITVKKAKIKVSKKDKRLIVKFCKKHYGKRTIKIVREGKVPASRKSKKYVYVEKMKTTSLGNGWGRAKTGIIKYNKTVKKGKKVKVYSVWNPKNNVIDDVTAIICQGKIR